jgi:uncharacterized membrane-anchored protein
MNMGAKQKGLILAGIQLLLALSIGGKLLYERATLPRLWVRAEPVDPYLLFRGRYVSLGIEAKGVLPPGASNFSAKLAVENGVLVARQATDGSGQPATVVTRDGVSYARLEPAPYFIPENVPDPSLRRRAGEELWVEVTVPHKGPLRPLRLGVKKDGVLTPLDLD